MQPVKKKPARKRKSRAKQGDVSSFLHRLKDGGGRLALAGAAGGGVLLLALGVALWASGFFGQVARQAEAQFAAATVKAGFGVHRITLRGAHELTHEEVVDAIGPVIGQSLLHFSAAEAKARLEELGWVRAASVTRLWPSTVHVSIRERKGEAVWQMDGRFHLVDGEGAPIRELEVFEYAHLPLIVGAGAPAAAADILAALERHSPLKARVHALIRVSDRRWNIRFRNGVEAKLPAENAADAVDTLALLQAAQKTLDQPIALIDLRDPERMIIKKRIESAQSPPETP